MATLPARFLWASAHFVNLHGTGVRAQACNSLRPVCDTGTLHLRLSEWMRQKEALAVPTAVQGGPLLPRGGAHVALHVVCESEAGRALVATCAHLSTLGGRWNAALGAGFGGGHAAAVECRWLARRARAGQQILNTVAPVQFGNQ